jgi:hypothetical protein
VRKVEKSKSEQAQAFLREVDTMLQAPAENGAPR